MNNPFGGQPPYGPPGQPNGFPSYPGAPQSPNGAQPYAAPGAAPQTTNPYAANPQTSAPQGIPQPGYGQPAPQQFGGAPNPYGAPNPGGAPNPYGAPNSYGNPNPYGAPQQPQPGAMPQQPYPGAQAPYGPATPQFQPEPGPPGIVVDTSFMPLAWVFYLTGPKIFVNGQQVPNASWGATHIPVGPGQHHVRVVTKYLWDIGPAETVVPVAEGQSTKVYYRTPAVMGMRGAIGPVPQRTPGIVFTYIMLGVAAFFILISVLLSVAGGS